MSNNVQELAEALLKQVSTSQSYTELVSLMKSSNNTLKEDIEKLREGAKLECKVDVKKMHGLAEELESSLEGADDELSSVLAYIEEAQTSIGQAKDYAYDILNYLDGLEYEAKEEDTKEE